MGKSNRKRRIRAIKSKESEDVETAVKPPDGNVSQEAALANSASLIRKSKKRKRKLANQQRVTDESLEEEMGDCVKKKKPSAKSAGTCFNGHLSRLDLVS
jgi:hypothetical protein